MGKLTVSLAIFISALFLIEQFSGLFVSESDGTELVSLGNFPLESETGEDVNENELKEHKILSKDFINISKLASALIENKIQSCYKHPVNVILDVITPPPEA